MMAVGMMLLVLAVICGGYATFQLLNLFASMQTGSLGAAYLVTTALAALFTLVAFAASLLFTVAWLICRRIERGNWQRERLIGQMNLFELRIGSLEQKAVQAGWAAIDKALRQRDPS